MTGFEKLTLTRALRQYGADAQVLMVMEEMAELQKELCKRARGKENVDDIAQEIADVQIMLDQMILLYHCARAVQDYRALKLLRLDERLREGGAGEEQDEDGGEDDG